ncbi:uncharacterized protein LOC144095000 isoform X3 [Amblyomma americanum]
MSSLNSEYCSSPCGGRHSRTVQIRNHAGAMCRLAKNFSIANSFRYHLILKGCSAKELSKRHKKVVRYLAQKCCDLRRPRILPTDLPTLRSPVFFGAASTCSAQHLHLLSCP